VAQLILKAIHNGLSILMDGFLPVLFKTPFTVHAAIA
jgi:hypothetical protein